MFGWMRNKLCGKDGSNYKPKLMMQNHMMHQPCKEEFNDWPNALLAIGTLGNSKLKDSEKHNIQGSCFPYSDDHLEYSRREDFGEVDRDKELRVLPNQHISIDANFPGELQKPELSLQKFLDSLPEDDRTIKESINVISEKKDSHFQQTSGAVCSREGKHISLDNKKNRIGKKSLSFLLKKAFLCKGGFVSTHVLKDPIPETKLDNSKLDKILRAILHKKVYPQRSIPKATSKKYLDMHETDSEDEVQEETNHGSKWVKTDAEYIVLEI